MILGVSITNTMNASPNISISILQILYVLFQALHTFLTNWTVVRPHEENGDQDKPKSNAKTSHKLNFICARFVIALQAKFLVYRQTFTGARRTMSEEQNGEFSYS